MRTGRGKSQTGLNLFLLLVALFQLFPILMMAINSFRTDKEIKNSPIGFPSVFSLDNYVQTWIKGEYAVAFRNSLLIGVVTVLLVLITAGLCGYALALKKVPGKTVFNGYFTVAMSFPAFLYIVPRYYGFSKLGLVNNHIGLIMIYVAIYAPFSILLIRTFLLEIPGELIEAARVDGCGEFSVITRIVLPLAKPVVLTVALIIFTWTWNEFMWSNTFIVNEALRTVSTRFYKFTSKYTSDLAKIYTSGVITLGPIIAAYLLLQKSFIEGLTSGSVKG